jgi:hypothetical protein
MGKMTTAEPQTVAAELVVLLNTLKTTRGEVCSLLVFVKILAGGQVQKNAAVLGDGGFAAWISEIQERAAYEGDIVGGKANHGEKMLLRGWDSFREGGAAACSTNARAQLYTSIITQIHDFVSRRKAIR